MPDILKLILDIGNVHGLIAMDCPNPAFAASGRLTLIRAQDCNRTGFSEISLTVRAHD